MCLTALSIHATAASTNHLSYTFSYTTPGLSSQMLGSYEFTKISEPNALLLGTSGEPALPVSFVKIALPPMTTVASITVTGQPVDVKTDINLLDHPVKPYQNPIPFGSPEPTQIAYNQELYQSTATYPETAYNGNYQIGYCRGYAILSLGLQPVQYLPMEGKLRYYPQLTVSVNLQSAPMNSLYRNSADDEAWVQALVCNPDIVSSYRVDRLATSGYPGGLCDPSHHYDYVIITTTTGGLNHWDRSSSTPYNWTDLITQEGTNGLSATIVTVQDINACTAYQNSTPVFNDQQAHIREFCKDAYADWGTQYILVVGDATTIPARLMDSNAEYGVDADIYWSNLDNTFYNNNQWGADDAHFDLYSELYLGRLTASSPQDVSNWMTKSLNYAHQSDPEILNNAAFYGGDTGWDCTGDDFEDFSGIKTTTNYLGPVPDSEGPWPSWFDTLFGFETWNANYPGIPYNLSNAYTADSPVNPGWQGNGVQGLRTAINNDQVSLLSGIAHADSQMSLDVDYTTWETSYHNTHPFFITDYGCHCGDFDDTNDELDAMLFHSDTYLAFGCVYNTGYGWGQFEDTNSSSAIQQKMFWDYFFDLQNNSGSIGNWQAGKGHMFSKDEMAPTIDWDSGGSFRETIQCMALFGDPAQMLKPPRTNVAPTTPTQPVGPTVGTVAVDYTFTTSATDHDNDTITYLFDWGDGTNSGWVGPYPTGYTASAGHIWTAGGTYDVTVKARDACCAESNWSTPASIVIGAPNISCKAIRGGLGFKVVLVNTGDGNATVNWRITVTGGFHDYITRQTSGMIHGLAVNKPMTLEPYGPIGVMGIGKININLKARATYANSIDYNETGFLFGPFFLMNG